MRKFRTRRPTSSRSSSSSNAGEQQQQDMPLFPLLQQFVVRGCVAAGLVYCFTEYVVDITLCEGPSMFPTIDSAGEIILLDKWSYRRYGMQDGCTVQDRETIARERQKKYETDHSVFSWHRHRIPVNELQIVRPLSWIGALRHVLSPLSVGDVVVIDHPARPGTVCKRVVGLPGDQILCNRRVPFRNDRQQLLVVPDGHMWLEGDNPANSSDSRDYGPVPAHLLVGRVLARIWPIRGNAWMRRGAPPPGSVGVASTVLPAGYEGQTITKRLEN